jgi:hypothetical protein
MYEETHFLVQPIDSLFVSGSNNQSNAFQCLEVWRYIPNIHRSAGPFMDDLEHLARAI